MEDYLDDPLTLDDERQRDSIEALLRDIGADEKLLDRARRQLRNVDVRDAVNRFKAYAQQNPAVVLGALSAVVVGGGAAVAVGRAAKKSKKKTTTGRKASSSSSSKRTLIEPHPGDKRYIRRDKKGRIKESVDVGKSLSADRRRHSKTKAKPGRGDKGDR